MIWYLRGGILLPLLLPGAAYELRTLGFIDPSVIIGLVVGSILIGGVPYVLFGGVGLVFLWHRDPEDYLRWAVRAPVVFIPFLIAFCWLAIEPIRSAMELFDAFVFMFCLGVPIGYAYVGLYALGWWLLCRIHTQTYAVGTV